MSDKEPLQFEDKLAPDQKALSPSVGEPPEAGISSVSVSESPLDDLRAENKETIDALIFIADTLACDGRKSEAVAVRFGADLLHRESQRAQQAEERLAAHDYLQGCGACGHDTCCSVQDCGYKWKIDAAEAELTRLRAELERSLYVLSLDEFSAREKIWDLLRTNIVELTPDRKLVEPEAVTRLRTALEQEQEKNTSKT